MAKYVKVATPGVTSIATTSTTDEYVICPKTGKVTAIVFSSLAALALHADNHVTFTATNLGQDGSGTNELLLSGAAGNTTDTDVTGSVAISANTKKTLTLNTDTTKLAVVEGDRIRIRATAAGTLAGAVTRPVYEITVKTAQR
jgi:hypothetical protein